MDDKLIMSTILGNVKGACDLMLHGTIESETPDVHGAFNSVLNDTLCMQNEIYAKMSSLGWYQPDCAEAQKIAQTKQEFQSKG
ncbi:MAG: spore coat protein [Clostridia bacterium]|nr:spore coat protein [Clostridia bacterium]